MTTLPKDNQVVSGINWEKIQPGNASVSVEAEFANRQGLKLGDTIGFQVADQYIEGTIVQFRKVEWESFKPNFFVIFAPLVIDQFPHSYITSLYLSPSQKTVLSSLIKEYSEISVIDIDAFLVKIRQMVDKISISLQILIMMVFVMGIMIMYASLLSSIKERLLESAMLQILGAKKQFIAKVLMVEFGVLGFTSGLIASLMAMIVAQDIAQRFFNIHLYFQVFWVGVGTVASTMVVILFGLIGARSVFRVSPLWLLRQSA
jgi:putative ABC transport system permease protein